MAKRGRPRKRGGIQRADLAPNGPIVDSTAPKEVLKATEVSSKILDSDSRAVRGSAGKRAIDVPAKLWGDEEGDLVETVMAGGSRLLYQGKGTSLEDKEWQQVRQKSVVREHSPGSKGLLRGENSGSRFSILREVDDDRQHQSMGEIAAAVDAQLCRIISSPLNTDT
ncbi:hypothetical protein Dimus_024771 [Dionaea muscipula]